MSKNFVLKSLGRDDTFTGRTKLWGWAIQLIAMKPLWGWSFDGSITARAYLGGRMSYGQFHNGYLDLLVRGGVIGLTLFVLILMQIIRRLKQAYAQYFRLVIVYLAIIIAFLLHNITEASIVCEINNLWAMLMFVYFSVTILASQDLYGIPLKGQNAK